MSPQRARALAQRYVAWLERWRVAVMAVTAVLFGIAVWLVAFHLPLKADLAELLPKDAPAVRDLHRLEARVAAQDTALILVVAADPKAREAAQEDMAARLRALPARLVDHIEADDADTRAFLKQHRHLLVPLDDLNAAADALEEKIKEADPLYINLDDDQTSDGNRKRLDDLDAKRKEAEAKLERSGNVNGETVLVQPGLFAHEMPPGTIGLIVLKTAFAKTDVSHGRELVALLRDVQQDVMRAHPGVDVGLAGGVVSTTAEHDALLHGMVLSSLVTGLLVGIVLMLFFRSVMLLVLLSASLIAGTTLAFGAAAITVGELNAATAFLGAIIAGNGVNYGILLIARFLEERRRHAPDPAMARAIQGTLRPTLVASLGASIAYGSLYATSFRGFADFAIIGAIGMVLCWISAYVLLPAIVLKFYHRREMPHGEPLLGGLLARMLGFRHPAAVCLVASALAIGGGIVVWRYIAADPFEYNIKNLRSDGDEALLSEHWMKVSNKTFGAGISGQTYIAADRRDQVAKIVKALRDIDAKAPPHDHTIGTIRSILDVEPDRDEQTARIAVLRRIDKDLDNPALDALDPDERKQLEALRPTSFDRITDHDLPAELQAKLKEKNGDVGLIIGIRPDPHLDEWNGHDLIRFSNAVRRIKLPPSPGHPDGEEITTSGPDMIFADIVHSIRADGSVVTALAALGLIVMVVLVVGRNRRAVAVLAATALGSLGLVAVCALLDLKVNFLDFVALPITLGLGVDYAINVAHRHDHQERRSARETLRTSGASVFVCSMTTIIGYGSLLVSDNLAIRGFGKASLIGEITCLTTALVLVPALLSLGRPPSASSSFPRQAAVKAAS